MTVTRIQTGLICGDMRHGILAAGYFETRIGPDPDTSDLLSEPMRVVDVGPAWIDVENDEGPPQRSAGTGLPSINMRQ